MTRDTIKAQVMFEWNNPQCKFLPGLHAIVNKEVSNNGYTSKRKRSFEGKRGKVIAVSTPDGKTIRGNGNPSRMYTNYYLEFSNGEVVGFDSMHLDLPRCDKGGYEFGFID